ncbi:MULTISPECIES: DoxX family protein [unclassified Streptomyces]|uniref:DoxX family protein n=1 Tax=unclassified Streptomyces TaxID=2593676 RepID=UPI000FA1BB67|nr:MULTISPECIES: DoxX family protein [unclassified Streptomyces]MDH6451075.1 putative membrane protein YphA (DoxX/SURF4 family) [Streptomyces sp. SAI-119]MDH6498370.1 putative membrane protein YphA (DoxX/SURF4 family) [Streptomyces sp. SAI-149]QUC62790.1 DoxX family membrane protein [Streptomyces sp. A2-16]
MSVDTRTPRTPTGDGPSGFDDAPALSMVKVPSDPAQIIVNHASFRVQLGASTRRAQSPRIARHLIAAEDTARMPAVGAAGRRRPVVWSGRSAPDDTGAHRLLQAVRGGSVGHAEPPAADAGATQVIPRIDVEHGYQADYDGELAQTMETPVVGAQRTPDGDGTRLLPDMRPVGSAYDEPAYAGEEFDDGFDEARADRATRRQGDEAARHAYYPGRRMNLGVVLLPLRIFLGFISIYAGMGKLCDPVYFDGGKRGSMVKWLNTLHPWEVAEPLRQFALQHPVGSGLVIAFLQVIVGVLTILGCWQRVAAVVGAGLSAALLVTVSWKSVPAYDTPDIIYLAAWSPLIIAGAPVYSIDGRLAGAAWRRLGPRSDIWELRRYVLRRGALITAIVTGLTLLIGSVLGGAVRDADRVIVPGPGEAPRNELPGSPLPQDSAKARKKSPSASTRPSQGATSGPSAGTSAAPGATRDTGTGTGGSPSQTQGTTGRTSPQQSSPVQQAPSTTSGPTGGTSSSGGSTGGSGTGGSSSGEPGLVGGLLG